MIATEPAGLAARTAAATVDLPDPLLPRRVIRRVVAEPTAPGVGRFVTRSILHDAGLPVVRTGHTALVSGRYYEAEHFEAYARLRREGLNQWSDLHPCDRTGGYDDIQSRPFLDRVLPTGGEVQGRRVLEYGCGTGGAACYLAQRGFRVDAVDLVPDAIELARRRAAERGLEILFAVQDVCHWTDVGDRFDYVIDIFCLQSIVTDDDRARLLSAVRTRLKPDGRYLISTAMFEPERVYDDNDHYDQSTGIVWTRVPKEVADAVRLGDSWFVPNRRHLAAAALRRELERHQFTVLEQSGRFGGELVCTPN
ncbi:methyltransferase domain-containing protein [Microlunatus sp. Gsoil 973]|nr:methyltransferase domain-containing protein [Microlunatus sp. Gsoil 973]